MRYIVLLQKAIKIIAHNLATVLENVSKLVDQNPLLQILKRTLVKLGSSSDAQVSFSKGIDSIRDILRDNIREKDVFYFQKFLDYLPSDLFSLLIRIGHHHERKKLFESSKLKYLDTSTKFDQ